jgi:hypothetical protein
LYGDDFESEPPYARTDFSHFINVIVAGSITQLVSISVADAQLVRIRSVASGEV